MLFDVRDDAGLGFCHTELPQLLPTGHHGPLVVALDSNALIDLQQHGNALLDSQVPTVDAIYRDELAGLANLLHLWLLRDIRFVVTPRARTDAKKMTQRFLDGQMARIDAIADSLAFQLGDWEFTPPSHARTPAPRGQESGLPDSADRDLLLEAQAIGVHVFVTRDEQILRRASLSGPALSLRSPKALGAELEDAGITPWMGGTCGSAACPYRDWGLLAPDMGKWGPLLAVFDV